MKAVVAAFNQEKALVGAFSVIVKPVVEPMDRFTVLLQAVNTRLRENMAVVEEDNTHLKEYVENLRSDIDSLLKLSARARDSGVWDPHDLSWCEVTFEQVFGGEEERPGPSPRQPVTVRKVSRGSHQSSELYDSRQVPCHH